MATICKYLSTGNSVTRLILSSALFFLSLNFSHAEPLVVPDGYEPPANPWLADSVWPMSHRNPYAQGSSPYFGPTEKCELSELNYTGSNLTNITLAMSPVYPNGDQVYWGSTFGNVYKMTVDGDLRKIDTLTKPGGVSPSGLSNATSGAYTLVDRFNHFFTVDGITLVSYTDSVSGAADSPISEVGRFDLPAESLRGDSSEDPIVGVSLMWDGMIAIATKLGTVAVVSRDFSQFYFIKLGDPELGEEVSNSIAADENGGIYVVSAKKMYRVQWTGVEVSLASETGAWVSDYEIGEDTTGNGRLGAGSGSTPSLMGTGNMDRFVVITDNQSVANLVLFWRDNIPDDWQPIAPGKDRRIAAEVPVDYGYSDRTGSVSEQSVLVRGYGAVVVSNDYRNVDVIAGATTGNDLIDNLRNGVIVAISNWKRVQPYGVHKFEWNPITRQLETSWTNNLVSCPNGIPTMSASANLFYCIGARRGKWTLEAIDWSSGHLAFYRPMSNNPLYNSFYAATQIGNNGSIVTGTILGALELSK